MRIEKFKKLKKVEFRKSKRSGSRWTVDRKESSKRRLRAALEYFEERERRFREAWDHYVHKYLDYKTAMFYKKICAEWIILECREEGEYIVGKRVKVEDWLGPVRKPGRPPVQLKPLSKRKTDSAMLWEVTYDRALMFWKLIQEEQ